MFDIPMLFLKEFFSISKFLRKSAEDKKKLKNYPECNELRSLKFKQIGLTVEQCLQMMLAELQTVQTLITETVHRSSLIEVQSDLGFPYLL